MTKMESYHLKTKFKQQEGASALWSVPQPPFQGYPSLTLLSSLTKWLMVSRVCHATSHLHANGQPETSFPLLPISFPLLSYQIPIQNHFRVTSPTQFQANMQNLMIFFSCQRRNQQHSIIHILKLHPMLQQNINILKAKVKSPIDCSPPGLHESSRQEY